MDFKQLNIIPSIMKAVQTAGYTKATEIQYQSIPHILNGHDLIGCAQTGTGKTASFAIPVLQLLDKQKIKSKGIRSLVLTPTRELAVQISENFKTYGQHLNIKHLAIFGGVPQSKQVKALNAGIDILIATPGRLLDLIWLPFGKVKLMSVSLTFTKFVNCHLARTSLKRAKTEFLRVVPYLLQTTNRIGSAQHRIMMR